MKRIHLALALTASLTTMLCSSAYADEQHILDEDTQLLLSEYDDIISDIPYIDDGNDDHMLDLFGTSEITEKCPVIIEVHGGGFIGGNKTTNTEHSIILASNGFEVVTPDYVKLPDNSFKDAIQDLFTVYQWVEDNAETYHFDLDNIFIDGDSAGGYYVLMTQAIWNSEDLQEYFEVTPPGYSFKAVIASAPVPNLYPTQAMITEEGESLVKGPNGYIASVIGPKYLYDKDLMEHLHIMGNADPAIYENCYICSTPEDKVTREETLEFVEWLTDAGVNFTFADYEDQGNGLQHVFNIGFPAYIESVQANSDMIAYMKSLM